MINIVQYKDVYIVRFPYSRDLIARIKNVPGKRWDSQKKYWTIPKEHLGWFIAELKDTPYESQLSIISNEQLNVNDTLDSTETSDIPDIDISDITQYVASGSRLYEHQLDFLKYAKSRMGKGFILCDEMGCGKTLEVMNYALYARKKLGYKHCLIICCVNSAKFSWEDDIQKHTNAKEHPYILGTRCKRSGGYKYSTSGIDKLEDLKSGHMYGDNSAPELPYFLILNIESLRVKKGKKYVMTDKLIELINSNNINLIAIDEVHKNMSPKSVQGKLILNIKKKTEDKAEWIPMTGTPITNKPTDVFTPLRLVNGHSIKSFWEWENIFCIMGGYGRSDIIGYKNIPKLKEMLQHNMLRRLKSDVLDLPPKIYYTEYVENTEVQQKLYLEVESEILNQKAAIIESINPLAKMLKLRQVNGSPELIDANIKADSTEYLKINAKLTKLIELVTEIIQRGEKVVVFSNWVQHLRPVYLHLKSKFGNVTCFTGTMSEQERQKHKNTFINNPEYKIMIGTIGALGTNHTLTVANNVIFYDEPWISADKIQAEDRTHRAGTTKSVNIYTIITKGTIDETVHKILYDKQGISDYIVDDRLDIKDNPDLFDMLLGNENLK